MKTVYLPSLILFRLKHPKSNLALSVEGLCLQKLGHRLVLYYFITGISGADTGWKMEYMATGG